MMKIYSFAYMCMKSFSTEFSITNDREEIGNFTSVGRVCILPIINFEYKKKGFVR